MCQPREAAQAMACGQGRAGSGGLEAGSVPLGHYPVRQARILPLSGLKVFG